MDVQPGELVAVVGHIGSGKSSLLAACLNEMETMEGHAKLSGSGCLNGAIEFSPTSCKLVLTKLRHSVINQILAPVSN